MTATSSGRTRAASSRPSATRMIGTRSTTRIDDRGSPRPFQPRRGHPARTASTRTYTALAHATRTVGLQGRTRWFYALLFTGLVVALGGAATGLILLDTSWLVLLIAGALGRDLHPVRLPRPRGVTPAGPDLRAGQRPDRPGTGHAVRRHQLRLVDEQAHPSPRQPEQDRQGPRHRDRHDLLPSPRTQPPDAA